MEFRECAYCLTKVMFKEDGICLACGADSNVKSEKTRSEIEIEATGA